jgi:hypothetical protein
MWSRPSNPRNWPSWPLGTISAPLSPPKPYRRTTIPGEPEQAAPDVVARDFTADRPGANLVGDITHIPT